MAVYDRSGSSNLPVVRQPSQVQSREIGEIIIKSFETVTEALGDGDVPVNSKQIEDAIVKGINRSKIVKNGFNGSSGNANGEEDYYQKLYKAKYEDYFKNKEKREQQESEREIQERQRKWSENVDKAFSEINKWSANPLKGASDVLDKGIKTLLGKKDIKDPSTQAIVESNDKMGNLITDSIIELGSSFAAVGKFLEQWKDQQDGYEQERHVDMDSLIQETKETKENTESQSKEEKKSNTLRMVQMGLIVAAVTGVAATIPLLISGVADFFAQAPIEVEKIRADIKGVVSGPNSVGKQIEMGIRSALGIGALSKDEKGELKQLQKFKDKNSNDKWYRKQSKSLFKADRPEEIRGQIITNLQDQGYNINHLDSDEDLFNTMSDFLDNGGSFTGKYQDYYDYLGSQFYNESMESRLQELEGKKNYDYASLKQQQEDFVKSQFQSSLEQKGVTQYQADAVKNKYGIDIGQEFINRMPTGIEKVATRDDEYRNAWSSLGHTLNVNLVNQNAQSPYAR